jgi:hypothetical protein
MYFEFYLDDLEIEEPQGFADIILNMKRDDNWHGIFFEASASELAFYGAAASYLINKKATEGLKSEVAFKAYQACGVYEQLELIFEGRLDFGKYTPSCGNTCLVKIPVEQTGCLMTLRNRYDQKVDLDGTVTFNKMSALQQYDKLNFEMDLPAKELQAAVDGSEATEGEQIVTNYTNIAGSVSAIMFFRPEYSIERYNNISTGQLTGGFNCQKVVGALNDDCINDFITPQLLLEDDIDCFDGNFQYSSRMKGSLSWTDLELIEVKQKIIKWDGNGDIYTDGEIVAEGDIFFDGSGAPPGSIYYDNTVTGTTTISDGTGFYAVLEVNVLKNGGGSGSTTLTYNPETSFTISAVKVCPDTKANVYMVNEALSRVTEAITDNCLKVKSDYYGRTDSQPYASAEDGCGSLRVLTSGLKIRRADNPAFFASLKDLFEGLRGIDNIGIGIEANEIIAGLNWLRIEPIEHFYQDVEVLRLPFVPDIEIPTQEQLHYSLIKSGYQKWEVEGINGLDEPNSNREYRTILTSVNNSLDITSKFVAGSYPIETTRQQSFAKTGAADTSYDNETFIICVDRQAYSFIVERGNISDAANVFSPETLYNWRIRPYSNLMRWFKSIANSYPNITDSSNKLYFSSGTGNFRAEGQLNDALCKLENGVKAENRDLSKMDFTNAIDATPKWRPDYPTFKYPLSVADYRTLKANPYGYISFQCGTGEWKKGYVQELRYRLNRGEADFILKLKYE